jgi:histidinol-phosphate aminotransferase
MTLDRATDFPRPAMTLDVVRPYTMPRRHLACDLALDSNEGQGPPASLLAVWAGEGQEPVRRYPSQGALEAQLAAREGVRASELVVTAGADDAIDRLCRVMLGPEREVILPVPTFEMIGRYARAAGGRVVEVFWGDGPWPRTEVLRAITDKTALIALVSPNNPTGVACAVDDLRAVACAAPHAIVLADLAYAEFDGTPLATAARDFPNVVVTRTLSKAWGLAGLRVGYAVGDARVVEWVRAAGAPYAVAGPSLAIASRWLDEGADAVDAFVARVQRERDVLAAELASLGVRSPPSRANFVLGRFGNALGVWRTLAASGIAVRRFPDHPLLGDALRITLPGDEAAFSRLRRALQMALRPANTASGEARS